jgi:hypothetical protein
MAGKRWRRFHPIRADWSLNPLPRMLRSKFAKIKRAGVGKADPG